MKNVNEMNKEDLLSESTLAEVFDEEDEIKKAMEIIKLSSRAKELKVKSEFETLLNAFKRVKKEMERERRESAMAQQNVLVDRYTNFIDCPYSNMACGPWIAAENGIYYQSPNANTADFLACYHPILPVERLKNLETGEEQLKIAYKRNGIWQDIIVPKTMVSSANRIVNLSARGISVTSENAKFLVRFLADVENANENHIKIQYSSSKLGWIDNDFIPYDKNIAFDGDTRFRQIFDSVQENGTREEWISHVLDLRQSDRIEINFLLASSFASVLIKMIGGLPFFVDLWGETEGGKTVTLMLAASVCASPDESRYIGDFKTTDVALEAKADMLNNLPLILDDTSKTSSRIRENFEGIVYDLCSGKGKSRSNKDLGINRENRWKNCILTNGERPLNSYVSQGGAINRILEVECGDKVYKNPRKTAGILKRNYGFAGKEFISIIKTLGVKKILEIQNEFLAKLNDDEKMQKQSQSLAIVLTADKITTDYIFKDEKYINLAEAKKVLIDRSELSDNERAYRFILDKAAMNEQRFDDETKCEKWGEHKGEYIVFISQAFTQLLEEGGFSRKSFLSWGIKNHVVSAAKDNVPLKATRCHGNLKKCIWILKDQPEQDQGDGFVNVEYVQEKIPFD